MIDDKHEAGRSEHGREKKSNICQTVQTSVTGYASATGKEGIDLIVSRRLSGTGRYC